MGLFGQTAQPRREPFFQLPSLSHSDAIVDLLPEVAQIRVLVAVLAGGEVGGRPSSPYTIGGSASASISIHVLFH